MESLRDYLRKGKNQNTKDELNEVLKTYLATLVGNKDVESLFKEYSKEISANLSCSMEDSQYFKRKVTIWIN